MAKVRQLSAEARPARSTARTIETADPALAAALLAAGAYPSADAYRAVAAEYQRVRVWDKAHEYLLKAVTVDPTDAAAYEAMARLWRDWGLPHLGLGDAHRARHFAPQSPVVHNTLGTILQALGRRAEARKEYELALTLDPSAGYALNNLCYGWLLDGQTKRAIAACQNALQLQPGSTTVANNLAIAFAADGNVDAARDAFGKAGDPAGAAYNLGVVMLARRDYREAVKAFESAQKLRPNFQLAARRAQQARDRSGAGSSE